MSNPEPDALDRLDCALNRTMEAVEQTARLLQEIDQRRKADHERHRHAG